MVFAFGHIDDDDVWLVFKTSFSFFFKLCKKAVERKSPGILSPIFGAMDPPGTKLISDLCLNARYLSESLILHSSSSACAESEQQLCSCSTKALCRGLRC